jgi:hypothetical protein
VYAVVECSELEEDEEELKRSDLFVPFMKTVKKLDAETGKVLDRDFYLANTTAFVRPCVVIADVGETGVRNRYFHVLPRTEWANEFVKWIERPHKEDDMHEEDAENSD